jgi:hypothetical protein
MSLFCKIPLLIFCFILMLPNCELIAQTPVMLPLDANDLAALPTMPICMASAQAGYKRPYKSPSKCLISIQRSSPITPTAFAVPSGTVVYVALLGTRQNENVAFTVSAAKVTTPDTGAAVIKNIIPGLQTITATEPIKPQAVHSGPFSIYSAPSTPTEVQTLTNNIQARQNKIITSTNAVLHSVQSAATVMTCLSNYEMPLPSNDDVTIYKMDDNDIPPPTYSCSQQSMIARTEFDNQKGIAFDLAKRATDMPLRLMDQADLDSVVKSYYLTCLTSFTNMGQDNQDAGRRFCRDYGEVLSTKEALLDTAISDIQKAQDALIQNVQTLDYWTKGNGAPANVAFKFTTPKHVNMTVAITCVEVVSKTSSAIATVTINQSTNAVVVSTGIGFSNLKFNTYTAAPVIVNGQPILDPSGKTTTFVAANATEFSVVAPEALVSYRIGFLSHFLWETKHCPNNCSFLLSGGVGANLTTKTADFDVGPSFQVGGLLITPTVHLGRDTRLADGVTVGQMLGSSPPSSLPTTQSMVVKWGLLLTYSVPIP